MMSVVTVAAEVLGKGAQGTKGQLQLEHLERVAEP